ncbi:hypothetical protein, partial [Flavobacterium filum]
IKINNEKKKLIGSGRFSIKTYLNYYNQEYYNNLSREEKKRYNREKDSELIRADYNENISYDDNKPESIFAQFYYYKNQLFCLKLKISKNEKVLNFLLNQSEIESEKKIKNELGLELNNWIIEKSREILEFHNK